MVVENVPPQRAVQALLPWGGSVLSCPLSEDDERELQRALHGEPVDAAVRVAG